MAERKPVRTNTPPSTKTVRALYKHGDELAALRNLRDVVLVHVGESNPREVSQLVQRTLEITRRINDLEAALIVEKGNQK